MKSNRAQRLRFTASLRKVIPAILLSFACLGCAAPQYDDQTDKAVTTLQTDIDTQLISLITLGRKIESLTGNSSSEAMKTLADAKSKASFDSQSAGYDKIQVDLTTVRIRFDAEPSAYTAQADAALDSLNSILFTAPTSITQTHRQQNILGANYCQLEEVLLDQQLIALLKLELVLKNGGSAPSTK
jgi:hypothetical protein